MNCKGFYERRQIQEMMIPLTSSLLLIIAIIFLFGLTPERITEDLLKVVSPIQTLRDRVRIAQGRKKSRKIGSELTHIRNAMTITGKGNQFIIVCALSVTLMIFGGAFALIIGNVFLVPVFSASLCLIPFLYAKSTIAHYEKHIEQEMETALSIITTSYIRSDNIVSAVRENIGYIKPPMTSVFKAFLGDATAVSSDIKHALAKLKNKIDNPIYHEWCDALMQCQDDRTLKNTLLPIVGKLTDVRIVNNELKTMIYEPRKEYFTMIAMLISNIPLLYLLNQSWYHTLMTTTPGQFVLALSGAVVLVTVLLFAKYTKPIEYRR
jgi:hypothetical protein